MFKDKIIREIMFSYLHTLLRSLILPSSVLPDRETRLYMVSGKTSVDIITEPSSVVTSTFDWSTKTQSVIFSLSE